MESRKAKSKCKILIGLLTVLLLFTCTGCYHVHFTTNKNLYDDYRAKVGSAETFLPMFEELGTYENLTFSYKSTFLIMFETQTIALFIKYNQTEYETAKTAMLERYEFLENPVISEDGYYIMPVAELDYQGYHFQIAVDETAASECKSFLMAGYDDNHQRLAYCYFYDFDLDIIGSPQEGPEEAMIELIKRYFFWNSL